MTVYTVDMFSEICCDECQEVVHNHMNCPACGKEDVGTDVFCGMWEHIAEEKNPTIACEECDTVFNLLEYLGTEIRIEVNEEATAALKKRLEEEKRAYL